MRRFEFVLALLGVWLMSYFGSGMARALFPADLWGQTTVAGFALGILMLAQMGAFKLRARVAELERQLATAGVNARPVD